MRRASHMGISYYWVLHWNRLMRRASPMGISYYGVLHWNRVMGRASPMGISCSMTLVPLNHWCHHGRHVHTLVIPAQ